MSAGYRLPGPRRLSALLSYQRPLPAWLPANWQSNCYPKVGSLEAVWAWLDHEATTWADMADAPESVTLDGEQLCVRDPGARIDVVRDGYKLVRHLAAKHECEPPVEPQQTFRTTPEGCRAAAAELRELREWVKALPVGKGEPAARKRRGRPEGGHSTAQRVLGLLTERRPESLQRIVAVIDEVDLSVDKKLHRLEALSLDLKPFTAEKLATLLGVNPSTITRTAWWRDSRPRRCCNSI